MILTSIGFVGVFGLYAVVSVIARIFILLKVHETKGMLLEVITEFLAVGARQADVDKNGQFLEETLSVYFQNSRNY